MTGRKKSGGRKPSVTRQRSGGRKTSDYAASDKAAWSSQSAAEYSNMQSDIEKLQEIRKHFNIPPDQRDLLWSIEGAFWDEEENPLMVEANIAELQKRMQRSFGASLEMITSECKARDELLAARNSNDTQRADELRQYIQMYEWLREMKAWGLLGNAIGDTEGHLQLQEAVRDEQGTPSMLREAFRRLDSRATLQIDKDNAYDLRGQMKYNSLEAKILHDELEERINNSGIGTVDAMFIMQDSFIDGLFHVNIIGDFDGKPEYNWDESLKYILSHRYGYQYDPDMHPRQDGNDSWDWQVDFYLKDFDDDFE